MEPEDGIDARAEIAAAAARGGIDRRQIADAINTMRAARPRIHAIVSPVAQPLVANIAAALSIDISMTIDVTDIRAMVASSDAFLVNLGMLDRERRDGAMAAVASGLPFVLDPVKVDRSGDRLNFARALIEARPRIVKGNVGEMAALGEIVTDAVRVTTGAEDEIAAEGRHVTVLNDTPILSRVIATGCATGMLMTAISAVEDDSFVAAVSGAALMAVAGEVAAETAKQPGSFAVALIDALAELNGEEIARMVDLSDG